MGRGKAVIELASVIRDLRAELKEAVASGDGEALRFELGPIELEVSVALQREGSAGAKVRFFVVQGGADGKIDTTDTQRIKLTLTPRMEPGGGSPYVSGGRKVGE
ncbi:trypco2 family protein [Catenulispora rubra]|uniref:trypco2 family protein n=1 Tax=Catenulispora rubra TaxID=280293 RepID=UPI001E496DFD|nr:trypco2 family protein [Catenulispora rubra]